MGYSRPGQLFDVMAAVVDRIPHTNNTNDRDISQDDITGYGNPSGVLSRDGLEGISVAVLDSDSAAPNLWSARAKSNERETMTIQQRCTLSFSIPPSIHVFATSQKRGYQALVPRTLQLPVANTLFQNGKTSTLLAQRWTLHPIEDAKPTWILTKSTWLPQQNLNLANFFPIKEKSPHHSLYSHLTPITTGRIVTAAVGNIIRRLGTGRPNADHVDGQTGSAKEEEVPASTELETAIKKGIQEGRISPQPAGVWALVKPRNHALALRTTWWGTGPDKLQRAIMSGCRLHKVLSGGGGWGEKQGLLALDPDSDYTPRHQGFQSPFENGQSVEEEKKQAPGEVVKPGDKVMFYVCKPPESSDPSGATQRKESSINSASLPTMAFGSLPSTMDAMPASASVETNDSTKPSCFLVKNHFGMLSEQVQSTFYSQVISARNPRSLARELKKRNCPSYKKGHKATVTTKLDAPYTLLTIKGTLHAPFSEDALGGIDNPALDTDSSWIRAEDAGIGSSSNASLRRADQKTSRFGLKSYRLGSSGQRALSSDKASALNSRSFTTASIRLKKNEDLTSAIRVGRNPEEIKKGEQKLSHVAEKKILKIEQSRTRGGEKAKGRTQNSMIGATNPSIYQMEDPETLERASQEQTPLSTYSAKPEEDDDSSSAVLVDKSLGTKSRGETERSNIAKARKAWKRKQAKEKAANSVIGATNPSKDVTEDQETIERAPQNQARIRTYSAKPEEELPPHVRSQILKQTKSKIRKQKALVEGDPDFQNHPLSSTTHFKPRIEQAAGNVGRKSAREAETETASTIRYIEVDDAIHLTSPSKVDMQLAKPLTIRRHLAAPKTPHQDSEAPTVRYSAPDKTPRKAPFGEATTGPAEDAEMLTLRRYLAPARSTTAPNLGTYPEPDASSNESQSETESETRNSVINFLKEQDPWTSQNHPERTKRFRRLYQDLTKGTDEMPYVPAEGSPLIRYEATDKSQRLRDAYAMKQARDGFVIRKHGGPYVRVTKYGGGDSEIAMGQGREFSGEEERDVPAREDKRAVSAREYATGLHREYHSSMSDWE